MNNNQLIDSNEYKNYLYVRERILKMKDSESYKKESSYKSSDYWRDELENFDYMMDASPLIIRKL